MCLGCCHRACETVFDEGFLNRYLQKEVGTTIRATLDGRTHYHSIRGEDEAPASKSFPGTI